MNTAVYDENVIMNKHKVRRVLLTILASVVVFITTYVLIIPAITWDATLICDIPEHTHSSACYMMDADGTLRLNCGRAEHKHTDACFDAPKSVSDGSVCGLEAHAHTEDCYFEDGTLRCTMPEHVHSTSCFMTVSGSKNGSLLYADANSTNQKVDPDTSDLDKLFRKNGNYSADFNGMVAVDKTVSEGEGNQFGVTLSALAQSYRTVETEENRMHADVVFVIDGSGSMYRENMAGSNENRMMGVVKSINSSIETLLAEDPETRIGIVLYGTEYYPDSVYLPLDTYKTLPDADYLTYGKVIDTDGDITYRGTRRRQLNVNSTYGFIRINGTDNWQSTTTTSTSATAAYSEYPRYRITRRTGLVQYYAANSSTVSASVTIEDGSFAVIRGSSSSTFYIIHRDGDTYTVMDVADSSKRIAINGELESTSGTNPGTKEYTKTNDGTYTQAGIIAAKDMLINSTDKENRIPVMILISDGAPTFYNEKFENLSGTKQGDGVYSNATAIMGYYTVRSAMYAKQAMTEAYSEYNNGNESMFFSIGPGVDYLYGQTVLSPGGHTPASNPLSNLEMCNGDNTTHAQTGGNDGATPDQLYDLLMENVPVAELDYVNFADWSISGSLTADALEEGMETIAERIKKVPRPTTTTTITQFDSIDSSSMITFKDTLGSDMTVAGAPTLIYGGTRYASSSSTTGKFTSGEYSGCNYTMYRFSGTAEEQSTGEPVNFVNTAVYVIDNGDDKVVLWQFTSALMPVINNDTVTGTFKGVPPIRLSFTVEPEVIVPGQSYITNSTSDVATCTFSIADNNPYTFTNKTVQKTQNITETKTYSSSQRVNGSAVTVQLGNNGTLITPIELYVTKTWTDDNPRNIESVAVHLYADGVNTGKTITLTEANGWVGKFDGIPKYAADSHTIEYSVVEEAPRGYQSSGGSTLVDDIRMSMEVPSTETVHVNAKWEGLGDGGFDDDDDTIYRIIYNNGDTTYALSGSDTSLSRATASTGNREFTNTNQQWKVIDGNKLQNVNTGTYVRLTRSGSSGNYTYSFGLSDTASTFTTSDYSHLYFRYNSSNSRYLRLNSSISAATDTSNANSALTIQKLIPAHDEVHETTETVYYNASGFKLTNTPEPVDIPFEKVWTERVPEGKRGPISIFVYEQAQRGYNLFCSVDLDEENDWQGEATELDTTKTYYAVEQDSSGFFDITYSGGVTNTITLGGKQVDAVLINPLLTEKITVTNDVDENVPEYTKKIDALRDGEDNPDTDVDDGDADMTDLYRLYLTAGPESKLNTIDVVFVIDRSSSMDNDYSPNSTNGLDATDILNGTPVWRKDALNSMLNGLETPMTNNTDTLYDNGLISRILELNPENKVAVVWFAGNGGYVYEWKQGTDAAYIADHDSAAVDDDRSESGTNYVAGLRYANLLLQQNAVKNDGNPKYVVFISDGEPTNYIPSLDSTAEPSDKVSWGATSTAARNLRNYTNDAIADFKSRNPEAKIMTIAVGDAVRLDVLASLSTMPGATDADKVFLSTNFTSIKSYIESVILDKADRYQNLNVTDTLSEDVDFYNKDLDLVIKKTDPDGTHPVILYQNGKITTAGKDYIPEGGVTFPDSKTISVDYNSISALSYTLNISFNVKTTQNAYSKYLANVDSNGLGGGYGGVKGDPLTDYGTNATSSNKDGFMSNDEAVFSFTMGGKNYALPYDDPVIQVGTEELTVRKQWSDGGNRHNSDSAVVGLYMNGEEIAECTLNAGNSWEHTFEGLPINQEYEIKEKSTTAQGYMPRYSETSDGVQIISNVKNVSVDVEKFWTTKKESAATFLLYARKDYSVYPVLRDNGTQYSLTLTESDNWAGTMTNVPGPIEGEEYFIVERPINGYVTGYGDTELITIDGETVRAAKLTFTNGKAYASATNAVASAFPATGGILKRGTLQKAGAIILFAVLVGLWVLARRKEKDPA